MTQCRVTATALGSEYVYVVFGIAQKLTAGDWVETRWGIHDHISPRSAQPLATRFQYYVPLEQSSAKSSHVK